MNPLNPTSVLLSKETSKGIVKLISIFCYPTELGYIVFSKLGDTQLKGTAVAGISEL